MMEGVIEVGCPDANKAADLIITCGDVIAQDLRKGQVIMRAVVVHEHGGLDALVAEDRETPVPGPGEALVEVAAAGVNFVDIYQRTGAYAMRTPFVVGSEAAGVVAAIGDGVTGKAVGDRVAWVMVTDGTYATHAVVPVEKLVAVPADVDLEIAAAVMLQGLTAQFLCDSAYPVRRDDDVLVHAGAGGVGLLLTQMLVRKGARVFTTTSTPQKASLSRGAGATEVIDYTAYDVADEIHRLTDGHGAAVVYDGVGASTFMASLDSLHTRGTLVLFGAASGPAPPFDPQLLNAKGSLFLTRPTLGHYVSSREELVAQSGTLFDLVRRGDLDVRIGGRYPLDDAARAHEDLAARRTTGKLLIVP